MNTVISQTLSTLNLESNNISSEGARSLASALEGNTVRAVSNTRSSFVHSLHFLQTLKTLNLQCNNIGHDGAGYVANALKMNAVRPL